MSDPAPEKTLKVYLAGKISKNDWRHSIVRGLAWAWQDNPFEPWWFEKASWPKTPIDDVFTYVGPYFASCDHGCFHTDGGHGVGGQENWSGHGDRNVEGGAYQGAYRDTIARWCMGAIQSCDVLFAWLDDPSAHGTLAELGYARGLGKAVIVAASHPDLWLASQMATHYVHGASPEEAWAQYADQLRYEIDLGRRGALCESPIELAFWRQAIKDPDFARHLQLNHVVRREGGGSYRIDFAIPDMMLGIELDGYDYHSSKEQFTKDRQRQRELEGLGWRIMRFSGSEVHKDVARCVAEVRATWRGHATKSRLPR